jgi:hypothetical protein
VNRFILLKKQEFTKDFPCTMCLRVEYNPLGHANIVRGGSTMIRLAAAALVVVSCFAALRLSAAEPEPETFGTAWEKAMGVVEAMRAARASADELQTQLGKATDRNNRADLQKKLDEELKSVARIKQDLARKIEVALKLAEPTTAIDDVNRVRYLKCYLKYDNGDYSEAAEHGEFVAMRYPASEVARPCAKIALASYMQLYREKKIDAAKVRLLANHIVATWPKHADAVTARELLNQLK